MIGLLRAILALLLAAGATTVLAAAWPRAQAWIDFFLIAVVYYAITRKRSLGICMGAAGGLVADLFSSHILGFQAFVKTAVAYLVGGLGSRFMLNQPFPQFLALLLATLLDAALSTLLSFMVGLPPAAAAGGLIRRVLVNSLVGLMIYRMTGSGTRRPRQR